ncbi:glycosyltransferase [Phormidesmis priestleyi]|uniref:glycosyltransferase n=1 Tax=Phormidesmis priestleyi TaxID=268141 RepID=UPI00083A79AE|nr:glycosyltransferase [Phormidesmis priestleyi]
MTQSNHSQTVASQSVSASKEFSQPLVQVPISLGCEACVIVPIRNEAATLEATLTAFTNQLDLNAKPLDLDRYEIILLANNCSDGSVTTARQFAQRYPRLTLHIVEKTLPPSEAYIGRVRQMLMNEAHRRLNDLGHKRSVIASTDGDSQVSPTWIAAVLHEIANGADAVGGRIVLDPSGLARLHPHARACHLREVGYRSLIAELESYLDPDPCDPFPRHYQHYGASLAVTAEMYAQAGGLPLVRSPEDVALYRALLRVNARFRHSPIVRVVTSARQTGRTQIGLANQLNEWTTMGQQPFLVESAGAIATRLRARQQLRTLWLQILNGYQPVLVNVEPIAAELGISIRWLMQEISQPQTFGLLFERVEQRQQEEKIWAEKWALVDIRHAIQDLRSCLKRFRSEESRVLISA